MLKIPQSPEQHLARRRFLMTTGVAGLTAAAIPLLGSPQEASARQATGLSGGSIPAGDIAILKFLAAAELIEDDLWQQYTELATDNPKYKRALRRIDPAMVRYINDDRDDERSHANLINGFLMSIGEAPVNLDAFRTLRSSRAQGAQQVGRLTNLTSLTVDTSWFNRYRGTANPDLGGTFSNIVNINARPTIPTTSNFSDNDARGLAQAAAFHFAAIEQGGSSLYTRLVQRVQSAQAKLIVASIGPTEVYHFAVFHASLQGITALRANGVEFPNLKGMPDLAQGVFPEPCQFISADLPLCSVIRPSSAANAGAVAAATGLVNSGLFQGQSQAFFDAVVALATAADAA